MKRPILNKTPYELWNGKTPNISYFRVFGCKCHILNTKDYLGKFASKTDEQIFLGYSTSSKAYRVFNKRNLIIEESMHGTFDKSSKLDLLKGSVSSDVIVGDLDMLNLRGDDGQNESELDKNNETQEQHAMEETRDDQAYVDHQ